ncbi:SusC/RagA family TonB-linked outer membrane protein [uncultured Aquimarina sp.]|uniref:SusC/RagA family TonB-linked outer membrane protein n=1 Tax=uncultured Aquimarina sp. TaxID=575652 RepID=UPI00262CC5CD|nr:SusC/RagA family TonB-linked outer membrane protein [uncultured Aquimarina sp.]
MYLKKIITIVMVVLYHCTVLAQDGITLEGTVTSREDGIPIPGVNVLILGSNAGTTTDFDGFYQLKVKKGDVVSFSFTGKKTITISIDNQTKIDVALEEEASELEQVVVIGYGVQKKSSLTASVSKLENKNLDELPYSDVSNSIKGKIAGVQIRNTTGNVGDEPEIIVRGIGSISLSSAPLVVVDGFPFDDGLQFINPSTIQSIEVLKDASSTAIYGSRGANGVILVTTKEGKSEKTSYEFKSLSGLKQAARSIDILDAIQFSDLDRNRDQLVENFNAQQENREPNFVNYDNVQIGKRTIAQNIGGPTNWQDEALRNPARIDNYQLNIYGGGTRTNYLISANYIYDEGLRKDNDLERLNLSARLKSKLSDNLSFDLKINPSYTLTRRSSINFTDTGRYETWIPVRHNQYTSDLTGQPLGSFAHALHFRNLNFDYIDPVTGLTENTGNIENLWSSSNFNPISRQEASRRNRFEYRLLANGSVKWKIAKGLTLRSSLGGYVRYRTGEEFFGSDGDRDGETEGILADQLTVKYINENTLTYNRDFNGHDLGLLFGITYENTTERLSNLRITNFDDETITTLNGGTIIDLDNTFTLKDETILSSYLARVNYAYKDRYLISLAGRADGFNKFGKNNKYGVFPSVSIGWNVANENFWRNSIGNTVNNLKLRSSWGISGSAPALFDFLAPTIVDFSNYSLGNTGGVTTGQGEVDFLQGNPDITWETNTEFNNGIDLGLFNGAVNLTVDYYYKLSEKLLLRQQISNSTGFDEQWNNIGKVQNSGWEFDLSTNLGKGKLKWQGSANISFNENKLISFGGSERAINNGERTDQYITRVGEPYIQFYGYRTDGIFQTAEELANSPSGITDAVGGLKRVDVNGDGIINEDDRTVIGDPFPDFIWGFTNTFTYGNLDLNFSFQGSQGGEVVWGEAFYNEVARYGTTYAEDQWFNENIPASRPGIRIGVPWLETDYAVQDASYISLREVVLGYSIPTNAANRIGLEKMRVYLSGQNLWYSAADDYLGNNPEGNTDRGNVLIRGYQRGVTPVQRQLALGLDINF